MKTIETMDSNEVNCLIAKLEGYRVVKRSRYLEKDGKVVGVEPYWECPDFCGDWGVGGPLLEKYHISVSEIAANTSGDRVTEWTWVAKVREFPTSVMFHTPLEAAMRCLALSKQHLMADWVKQLSHSI